MNSYDKYIGNPNYVFHGTPILIKGPLEPRQAKCESGNPKNTLKAVYATNMFEEAAVYAIPKDSEEYYNEETKSMGYIVDWGTEKENGLKAVIKRGLIAEDAMGYVYIFNASNFYSQGGNQCVSLEEQYPIDIVKVYYRDFKDFFVFKNTSNKVR